jgi:hypothetical protein
MRKFSRGFIVIGIFLCLLAMSQQPAGSQAQEAVSATISSPDLAEFPKIMLYLEVRNAQGSFVHGISAEQIQVLENGSELSVESIQELRPGVQVVVAINPGPSFGVRNSKGTSRYDYLKTALTNWAMSRQSSTLDDWSLTITNGPEISHVSDSLQWLEALEEDQTNARTAIPNLDTLFRAVSLAADTPARQGMGRAVLFITPPLEGELNQPMDNLIAQANQQGVSVYAWVISATDVPPTAGMQNLTRLVEQTHGQILLYSGEETLPNPEQYLAPLRWIYCLIYQSAIINPGRHQVAVKIQAGEAKPDENWVAESPAQTFEIDLQPPIPTFVNPPIQIERKLPGAGEVSSSEAAQQTPKPANLELKPSEQTLQVIFDFPDGRRRPITYAALYVDGVLTEEKSEPPFDQFTWKLDSYLTSGTHLLQVQATDSLGLAGASVELPVSITVQNTASNPWLVIQRNLPILTVLLVVVAGAILLLVLLLGGQLRPAALRAARSRRRKIDPLNQPVTITDDSAKQTQNWASRLYWPQRPITPKAHAFLSRISDSDVSASTPPIPITSDEITLGSDPNLATLVLEDPSVEGLHARLVRQEDGYRLSDEGSVAGTWVNYSPVSQGGTKLIHGDLVHIGRIGFRFTLRQPTQVRKPVILPDTTETPSNEEPPMPKETAP